MDSVQTSSNRDSVEVAPDEKPLSTNETSNRYNIFGEVEIIPHIGSEFQAEIPSLIYCRNYSFLEKPAQEESMTDGSHGFALGLPLPLMWINNGVRNIKHEVPGSAGDPDDVLVECKKYGEDNIDPKSNSLKVKLDPEYRVTFEYPEELVLSGKHMKGCCLVPGSLYKALSSLEEASFLLGLYIFGKNLVQVRRFMGSQGMGNILCHYYGQFYRSQRYVKWLECRKMKRKRCVFGQKIFTGPRNHELLSRLLPLVPEVSQNKLLQVSRTFGEGKIALEEYVFTLKAIVGLDNLVEAVGIEKGKQDLIGSAMDSMRSSQAIPIFPEIPAGKECSKLTSAEIVNFLTGGFRISKARSNDLFWEAVWPRLLARGWHSEETSNACFVGSRHSLAFLVPGVKKFSKGRLVKGDHYFDSVADVLNKVAAQPSLIELEAEAGGVFRYKEENEVINNAYSDLEESVGEECPCYLKPRTPSHDFSNGMMFTVVDTSMDNGEQCNFRESKSLPNETGSLTFPFEEDDVRSCRKRVNGSNSADPPSISIGENNVSKFKKSSIGKKVSSKQRGNEENALSWVLERIPVTMHRDKKNGISKVIRPKKPSNCQSKPRMKTLSKSYMAPTEKCHKPTLLNGMETSCGISSRSDHPRFEQQEDRYSSTNLLDRFSSEVHPSLEMPSRVTPMSVANELIGNESVPDNGFARAEQPHDNVQISTLIDLNVPVYSDMECNGQGMVTVISHDQEHKQPDRGNAVRKATFLATLANSEQQPCESSRRQSTRNRPLTPKALEALAYGLLETKRKRKGRDTFSWEMDSRPSRRVAAKTQPGEKYATGFRNTKVEQKENNEHNGGMCSNVRV